MSNLSLSSLMHCFQGVTPCSVATCSRDGVPNVTYLSQLFYVDAKHLAMSCQFFNKTRRNLDEHPYAAVQVYDPTCFEAYEIHLKFVRSETSGPLFDQMSLRIDAIASHSGMAGVFKLLSADVCEVLSVERIEGFLEPNQAAPDAVENDQAALRNELRALQVIGERVCRAPDLETLLDRTLESLDELLGIQNSLVLLTDDDDRLVTIASHGYGEAGIGAEVALGEGLIGTVARERRSLRVSGMREGLRYGRAIRDRVVEQGGTSQLRPEIPLPGLPDAGSQIALPLIVQDQLLGVLAAESKRVLGLADWQEAMLEVVATQLAVGIDRLLEEEDEEEETEPMRPSMLGFSKAPPRRFTFYRNDDCVFVDGEYLIRNVPGKLLWKLLKAYQEQARQEFSNRELRLDPWLGLPAVKDNLESRLILLRKRLQEKCPDIRLVPVRRGHFALELDRPIELSERDSA
ncbi:MAG: GAF domain-containing protein [Myxococcales bacterium]